MAPGKLSRDDFDGGPASLDEIQPGLWLGNLSAAKDAATLTAHEITHILTVDSTELPTSAVTIRRKFVQLDDVAKEDLLGRLPECIAFIVEALGTDGGKILVHCFYGVSRSASVVAAFLMHSHQLDSESALQRVQAKRPAIGPNPGFLQQLQLFRKMQWRIDEQHTLYKAFRLRLASVDIQKHIEHPSAFGHLVAADPATTTATTDSTQLKYCCRKCRRILATSANHFQHPPQSAIANPTSAYDEHNGLLGDILTADTVRLPCAESIFVEPLAWMTDAVGDLQGKLHCPKCRTKVGSFDWAEGAMCPCGALVAPAFYLVPSKVEARRQLAAILRQGNKGSV